MSPVSWGRQQTEGKKTQGLLVGRDLNTVLSCPIPVTPSPSQLCIPEPKDPVPPHVWVPGGRAERWPEAGRGPRPALHTLPQGSHLSQPTWPAGLTPTSPPHGHIRTASPRHTSGPCRVGPGVATAWRWTALQCGKDLPLSQPGPQHPQVPRPHTQPALTAPPLPHLTLRAARLLWALQRVCGVRLPPTGSRGRRLLRSENLKSLCKQGGRAGTCQNLFVGLSLGPGGWEKSV